jgi:hypothetical protein
MIVITGIGIITFSITDASSKVIQNNHEQSSLIELANAVLMHGSTVIDNTSKTAIPSTSAGAATAQYWTYGQVAALAPSGIMNTNTYGLSWWNTYGSSKNPFPTDGIPSQYAAEYIIEAQPFDSTNNLSTYKIIAFVTNTTTGQMLTKQKMYFAKNASVVAVVLNGMSVRVNDGSTLTLPPGNIRTCGTYSTYGASTNNVTLFNLQNADIIYLSLIWNRYNSTSNGQSVWSACGFTLVSGIYLSYFMPAIMGYVTWNGTTIDTGSFSDAPSANPLGRFQSVSPKYTVQATLPKSSFSYWIGGVSPFPTNSKWLLPEMYSLWINPDFTAYSTTGNGVSYASAPAICSAVNNNSVASSNTVLDRYNTAGFDYPVWAWLSDPTCAAYTSYPTGYTWQRFTGPVFAEECVGDAYWSSDTPANGLLSVWCAGTDQDIYLPTQTGTRNGDKRWPIRSWYPPAQTATSYTLRVMFTPSVPL